MSTLGFFPFLSGTRHFSLRLRPSADTPSCSFFRIVSWASLGVSFALVSGAQTGSFQTLRAARLYKQSVVRYVAGPFLFRVLLVFIFS